MSSKFSQALTLMREAFADAQAGDSFMVGADLAGEVDGAQAVINAASAVQVLRVAQFAGRDLDRPPSVAGTPLTPSTTTNSPPNLPIRPALSARHDLRTAVGHERGVSSEVQPGATVRS